MNYPLRWLSSFRPALLWTGLALAGAVSSVAAGHGAAGVSRPTVRRIHAGHVAPGPRMSTRSLARARAGIAAAPPGFTWTAAQDSSQSDLDEALSVTFGRNGTVIVAGKLFHPGVIRSTAVSTAPPASDFAVAKYDGAGRLLWLRKLDGGDSPAAAEAVTVDNLDNVIAAGALHYQFTVAEWDADGNPRWQKGFGGVAGRDSALSVATDSVGNVFAGGYMFSSTQGSEFSVVKLAGSDGNLGWRQDLDSNSAADQCNSVAVDHDGNVVCCGFTTSPDSVDMLAAKFENGSGNILWTFTHNGVGTGSFDQALSVAVDAQNNVLLAGVTQNPTDDFAVAKLTPDGGQVWLQEFDGSAVGSSDVAFGVAADSKGDVVAAGVVQTDGAGDQFAVVKLASADGAPVWSRTLQGNGAAGTDDNVARAVAVDAQDNVIAAGWLNNATGHDLTVVKIRTDGAPVWRRSAHGSAHLSDEAYAVAVDAGGNAAAAGVINDAVTHTDFAVAYADGQPPLLGACKVTPTTLPTGGGSVNIQLSATDNIAVQDGVARISFPDQTTVDVTLASAGGDLYSGSYTLPANPNAGPQSYGVTVAARDTSGNVSAFAPCGVATVAGDTEPPSITNCQLSGNSLPDAGGAVQVTATIKDNIGVDDGAVRLVLTAPDAKQTTVPFTRVSGTDNFNGSVNLPANPAQQPAVWKIDIVAADLAKNPAQASCGSVTVAADQTPPSISNCRVSPADPGPAGGLVTISAVVTDDLPGVSAFADVLKPDNTVMTVPLTLQGQAPGELVGNFSLPRNLTGAALTFGVTVRATDAAGNPATQPCGPITQAVDVTPPVISACQVTPAKVGQNGGNVTLRATVTDDQGIPEVQEVYVHLEGSDDSRTDVTLQPVNGSPGVYSGVFAAPATTTGAPLTYSTQFLATDTSGNLSFVFCDDIVIGADIVPPTIANARVSRQNLDSVGGPVTLSADVSDNVEVGSVKATVKDPEGQTTEITLDFVGQVQAAQDGPRTYVGVFNAPANTTPTPRVYTVAITALDSSGLSATQSAGSITVAGAITPKPTLSNCVVDPRTLPAAGGTVNLSVDVTDATGIRSVTAIITRPAPLPPFTVALTRQVPTPRGVSPNGTYVGSFDAPANATTAPQTYGVTFQATNTASGTAEMECGSVTVAGRFRPIALSNCRLSPTTLGSGGGATRISVDVDAPAGVQSVVATVTPPSGKPVQIQLSPQGTGGKGQSPAATYSGVFNAPGNTSTSPQTYRVSITGTDVDKNVAVEDCGPLTVAAHAARGGVARVTPTKINFGNIRVGWGDWKKVTVQNVGDELLTGSVGGLSAPFSIVSVEQPGSKAGAQGETGGTPFSLAPGEKLTLTVQYAPVNHRHSRGTLRISSSDVRHPSISVNLSGVGCGTPAGHSGGK